MNRKTKGSLVLAAALSLGLLLTFQNCARSKFASSLDQASSLSIKCTADQVIDLSGNCINSVDVPLACRLNGQLVANGSSVQVFATETVPATSTCLPQTRTCNRGTLTGTGSFLSCQPLTRPPPVTVPPLPVGSMNCQFQNQTVTNGQSVLAWNSAASTSCQSQLRKCTNGMLDGSFLFPSCQTLTPARCLLPDGRFLSSGNSVTAFSTDTSSNCEAQKQTRTCLNGVLDGSFVWMTCKAPPVMPAGCNPTETITAQKSFIQLIDSSPMEISQMCVDGSVTTADGSLPTSAGLYLRFFNTCGNRACIKKGFLSGRVIELRDQFAQLECRSNQIPATVTNACQQTLANLPLPLVQPAPQLSDTSLASFCSLSGPPADGDDQARVRWVYTCGNRACRSMGFTAGRVIEYSAGNSFLECTREEILNQLQAGTLVSFLTSNVDAISNACVDSVNPTPSDSFPTVDSSHAVRFYNTCGNRFCRTQGFQSGRVTELTGTDVQVLCLKN